MGAIDSWIAREAADSVAAASDTILLAGPVLSILDWMQRLTPVLGEHQMVTDVGSTKVQIVELARKLYNQPGKARFLPGHPMAGKESGGAALAEAGLFVNAMWLFTPLDESEHPLETEWRGWVAKFGARTMDLDATRHDEICAWVSHLPQMLSTALAALLEETFGSDATGREEVAAIGGRALRETTRLGASPYSMWRDIALSNTEPIAQTLHALEQRLAHLRENLRTPELKEEFRVANEFRALRDR
jgi:prephenate dehydrogenase